MLHSPKLPASLRRAFCMTTDITLADAGKRFRTDWIFRSVNYTFRSGERYAVLGSNGTGKSTLMRVLSGHSSLTKGTLTLRQDGGLIPPDAMYRHVSYAAPYIELIEEFTLTEALAFHARLQPFRPNITPETVLDWLQLGQARHRALRFFSSGMKQRVKLALAMCANTSILLLDEPTTNLDAQGADWFHKLLEKTTDAARLVVIASNEPSDVASCTAQFNMLAYKSAKRGNL